MKQALAYTLKITVASLITVLAFVYLSIFVLRDQEIGWGLRYIEYKNWVASQLTTPKILFNGGSATLMGIRTDVVKDVTGMPAVNMGVNGGFSPRFLLEQTRPLLKGGDVLVMMPEYEAYSSGEAHVEKYDFHYERIHHPERVRTLPFATISFFIGATNIIDSIAYTAIDRLQAFIKGRHLKPFELTPGGDYDVCLESYTGGTDGGSLPNLSSDSVFIKLLKKYSDYATAVNAKLVFTFPPRAHSSMFDTPEWKQSSNKLREQFAVNGISVIGEPSRFIYPKSKFCNSLYHLNKAGAIEHTQTLAELLKPVIADMKAKTMDKVSYSK